MYLWTRVRLGAHVSRGNLPTGYFLIPIEAAALGQRQLRS